MPTKFRQPLFLADIFKKIRNFTVKGFTLVELLVVVAIIAILAVMFIPNIFSAKVSARDSSRTSDLNRFKAGLKMYSMINRGYPTTTDWISIEADADTNGPFSQALNNPNYLSVIPRDPSYAAGGEYSYKYIATTTDRYTLCAKTEGKEGYVCIDQDNNSVAAQVAYVPGLGGTPPATIIPTVALNGAAIDSPYTESDANTRFLSGLQFDVTNAVSATVNGGAPVSLDGGTLTAVSNTDAKTAGGHNYHVVVTSSDGHTAEMTITYDVGSIASACGTVNFTYNGGSVTYGTVISAGGKCWLDRNLGASQAATVYNDSAAYGDLFQWGRLADGHQARNSGITTTLSSSDIPGHSNFIIVDGADWRTPPNNSLWQGVSGINNPCPSGWRMPTLAEWTAETNSWGQQNYNGAFTSLKLTAAGYRNGETAVIYFAGFQGNYWSNSVAGGGAYPVSFNISGMNNYIDNRSDGLSVRCIKDSYTAIIPTVTLSGAAIASPYTELEANTRFSSGLQFTVTNTVSATVNGGAPVSLAGGVLTAVSNADAKTLGDHSYDVIVTSSDGHTANTTVVYHVDADPPLACGSTVNFTYKGSPVSYGTAEHNGKCWLDRNLGASQVATAYNDSAAYGDLFQWGRLDDGHQARNSGITTTLSGTDVPGHSNFIYGMGGPVDWKSPQNNNLWQGTPGINNPCPSGWRLPTYAEFDAERASWSQQNYNGAFASPLKLTAAGLRNFSDATLGNVGGAGVYWSSSVWGISEASCLITNSGGTSMGVNPRAYGLSARCVYDGTFTSSPVVPPTGYAMTFDGSDDYIEIADETGSLNITNNLTVEAWVKPNTTSAADDWRQIVGKQVGNGTSGNEGYSIFVNESQNTVYFNVSMATGHVWTSYTLPALDTWYHVTGTFQAGPVMKLYVNGTLVSDTASTYGTGPFTGQIGSSTRPLFIGGSPFNDSLAPREFNGSVDETRIYSRVLSPAEVEEHYNGTFTNETSLAGKWSFSEGSGATAADLSGNGNYGISFNPPHDYALQFNGTNSYASVTSSTSLNPTSQVTIEAWVKRNSSTAPDFRTIIEKQTATNESYTLFTSPEQDSIYMAIPQGPAAYMEYNSSMTKGEWQHVVGVYSGSAISMYVNYGLNGSSPQTGSMVTSTDPLFIGGDPLGKNWSTQYFDGLINGIRIYGKALPASIVKKHFAGDYSADATGCSGSCDLRAYWRMNEGSGASIADSSGNSNSGTLFNSPQWVNLSSLTGPQWIAN